MWRTAASGKEVGHHLLQPQVLSEGRICPRRGARKADATTSEQKAQKSKGLCELLTQFPSIHI